MPLLPGGDRAGLPVHLRHSREMAPASGGAPVAFFLDELWVWGFRVSGLKVFFGLEVLAFRCLGLRV